jgi:hypothetical protein
VTDRIFLMFGENGAHRCRKLSQSPNSEKDNEMKHLLNSRRSCSVQPLSWIRNGVHLPTNDRSACGCP